MPADAKDHQSICFVAAVRSAVRDVGNELSHGYAILITAAGADRCEQISVNRPGEAVVIHAAPEDPPELPIVLGYADATGEWSLVDARHAGEAAG